jgi:hypothetical protein
MTMTITTIETMLTENGSEADMLTADRPATPERQAQAHTTLGDFHSKASPGGDGSEKAPASPTPRAASGDPTAPRKPLPVVEALAEVRDYIDTRAGRDRTREIDWLRAQTARTAELAQWVAEAEYNLDSLRWSRHVATARLAYAREIERRTSQRSGWLRSSHSEASVLARAAVTRARVEKKRIEERLDAEERGAAKARHQQDRMEEALEARRDAEDAQRVREAWLDAHPEIAATLSDLSARARRVEGPKVRAVRASAT